MKHFYSIASLLLIALFLSSCLYDAAPSQPASQIDTWLLGQWITQDQSGKIFEAVVAPVDNTHYRVTFYEKDKNNARPWEFNGWISRVGDLKFLTLQSLAADPRYRDKYLFLHYELIAPEKKPPINAVPARRIRLSEPQLPPAAQHLDSYHLRQCITKELKRGTLLSSEKSFKGFSIWTRIGGDVTWPRRRL